MRPAITSSRVVALCGTLAVCTSACAGSSADDDHEGAGGASNDAGSITGGAASTDGSDGASAGPTDPLPVRPLEWVWVPFSDATCRDGSTAGIHVNANPDSDQLMIFLEGGGSCWNTSSCTSNPSSYAPAPTFPLTTGVFDRDDPANPVKDWNVVYVPYCTGDVHAGSNPGFDPGGAIGPQQFVGYTNLEKFLDRIVPTFPNVTRVLHTGFSAGAFGALFTAELVGNAFGDGTDFVVVVDSAAALSTSFLPPCLQRRKWTTWGFDRTFFTECGADCADRDDYLVQYPLHLSRAHPAWRFGIIEAEADFAILSAWGYTEDHCNVDVTQSPTPMDPATFRAGLLDFRARLAAVHGDGGASNFGTFYLPGSQHGWLYVEDSLYTGTAGGEMLVDWFAGIIAGAAPTHVGP